MIVTISGTPGAGKSTVGKLLAKKLRYEYYSVGAMRRAMARDRGMSLQEFNVLGESKAFTDRDVDRWQKSFARRHDNLVIEGRTSFYFIPHSVKVFLKVSFSEAARRIFRDKAHVRRFEASHHYSTLKDLEHGLRGRVASDSRRYRKYYNLNILLPRHYDLIINTSHQRPATTLRRILKFLAKVKQKELKGDNIGKKHGRRNFPAGKNPKKK